MCASWVLPVTREVEWNLARWWRPDLNQDVQPGASALQETACDGISLLSQRGLDVCA